MINEGRDKNLRGRKIENEREEEKRKDTQRETRMKERWMLNKERDKN